MWRKGVKKTQSFTEFCSTFGILAAEGIKEGRWERCGTEAKPKGKTAAVKIADGGEVGFCIDFSTMTEHAVWFASHNGERKQRDESAERVASALRIQMRESEEREGTRRARREWGNGEPLTHAAHPYLEKKRLGMLGAEGLRTVGDALLIPMWRNDEFTSVQRITNESKKFAPGAPSKGCVFWMEREGAAVTILAEGFATAATCFEAVKNSRVCVTFSAANMIEVATKLDWKGFVCVASDNDHAKPCPWCQKQGEHIQNDPRLPRPMQCHCNPGHSAALAASRAIKCGYALPPAHEGMTDWNDLFVSGLVKKEADALNAERPPTPFALRSSALLPISAAIMKQAKYITT